MTSSTRPGALPSRAGSLASTHRDAAREGTLLVVAVGLAFAASEALRLPESFWAVMSALIVARGGRGATFDAGWQRVRGVALGTVVGLGGVWLQRAGSGRDSTTIVVVGLLAFASAWGPALRSAPISALIVSTSGGIGAHSALQVAGLRAFEIAIGVAAAVLVGFAAGATRDRSRFVAAAAALLREIGAECAAATVQLADREQTRRGALRRLAALAERAAAEGRWARTADARAAADWPVRAARLLARTSHDAALFARLRRFDANSGSDAAELAASALVEVASVCAGSLEPASGAAAPVEAVIAALERRAGVGSTATDADRGDRGEHGELGNRVEPSEHDEPSGRREPGERIEPSDRGEASDPGESNGPREPNGLREPSGRRESSERGERTVRGAFDHHADVAAAVPGRDLAPRCAETVPAVLLAQDLRGLLRILAAARRGR